MAHIAGAPGQLTTKKWFAYFLIRPNKSYDLIVNEQARRRLGNEQAQIAGSFSIRPFGRSRWIAGRVRLLDNSARSEERGWGAARRRGGCPT
ncbi:MAG TPA: hypothetical protein VFE75_06260, partial [Rhodanobacter sp.]|nr:hypothetical protein [Rhodanobacter sp.]